MIYYEPERANPRGGIYRQRNRNLAFFQHLHNSFELICVSEGELTVKVDGCTHKVGQGKAILIFPNCVHGTVEHQSSKSFLVIFQKSLVSEFCDSLQARVPRSPVFPLREEELNLSEEKEHGRYFLKSRLYAMLHTFEANSPDYALRRSASSHPMGKLLTFIAEYHDQPICMKDAAGRLGYDHHYLSNLLQKNLGTTFRTLLNEYRVSHAKYLLTSTALPISHIAAQCGYESICSFNRNFLSLAKMTPSQYRAAGGDCASLGIPASVLQVPPSHSQRKGENQCFKAK